MDICKTNEQEKEIVYNTTIAMVPGGSSRGILVLISFTDQA